MRADLEAIEAAGYKPARTSRSRSIPPPARSTKSGAYVLAKSDKADA